MESFEQKQELSLYIYNNGASLLRTSRAKLAESAAQNVI